MATYFSVYMASGRATCRICKENIGSGELQVNATGGSGAHQTSGNIHFRCLWKQAENIIRIEVMENRRKKKELKNE